MKFVHREKRDLMEMIRKKINSMNSFHRIPCEIIKSIKMYALDSHSWIRQHKTYFRRFIELFNEVTQWIYLIPIWTIDVCRITCTYMNDTSKHQWNWLDTCCIFRNMILHIDTMFILVITKFQMFQVQFHIEVVYEYEYNHQIIFYRTIIKTNFTIMSKLSGILFSLIANYWIVLRRIWNNRTVPSSYVYRQYQLI